MLRVLSEHHLSQQVALLLPSSLTFSRPRKQVWSPRFQPLGCFNHWVVSTIVLLRCCSAAETLLGSVGLFVLVGRLTEGYFGLMWNVGQT